VPAALERAELKAEDETLEVLDVEEPEDEIVTEVLVLEAAMLETDDVRDEVDIEESEEDEDEALEVLDVEELEDDVDEEVTALQLTVIESLPQDTDSDGGILPVSRAAFSPDIEIEPVVSAVTTHFNTTEINVTVVLVFAEVSHSPVVFPDTSSKQLSYVRSACTAAASLTDAVTVKVDVSPAVIEIGPEILRDTLPSADTVMVKAVVSRTSVSRIPSSFFIIFTSLRGNRISPQDVGPDVEDVGNIDHRISIDVSCGQFADRHRIGTDNLCALIQDIINITDSVSAYIAQHRDRQRVNDNAVDIVLYGHSGRYDAAARTFGIAAEDLDIRRVIQEFSLELVGGGSQ